MALRKVDGIEAQRNSPGSYCVCFSSPQVLANFSEGFTAAVALPRNTFYEAAIIPHDFTKVFLHERIALYAE